MSDATGPLAISLRYYFGALLFVILAAVPVATTQTELVAVTGIVYLMMFAITWDVASGYTGQLNLGHAAFIAVGGYTTAILNISHGVSPFLSIPAAVVMSALAGLVVGLPALRIRGAYLALVTLIAPNIFSQLVIVFDGIFKGSFGFKVPPTKLAGVAGASAGSIVSVSSQPIAIIVDYYIAYATLVLLFLVLYGYTRTDAGKVLSAIREDEDALLAAGISPAKHKVFSFVVSASTAGLAGAMFVHSQAGFPHPDLLLADTLSLNIVIISVLGGLGTIIGPLVGALVFGGLQFFADQFDVGLPLLTESLDDVMPIILFVLGMTVIYYLPEGLVPGVLRRTGRRPPSGEQAPQPATDGGRTPLEQIAALYRRKFAAMNPFTDNEH